MGIYASGWFDSVCLHSPSTRINLVKTVLVTHFEFCLCCFFNAIHDDSNRLILLHNIKSCLRASTLGSSYDKKENFLMELLRFLERDLKVLMNDFIKFSESRLQSPKKILFKINFVKSLKKAFRSVCVLLRWFDFADRSFSQINVLRFPLTEREEEKWVGRTMEI